MSIVFLTQRIHPYVECCFSAQYDILGLTGFDGKMRWYVSMRRLVGYLLNLSEQKLIGERNYALAA